MLTCRCNSKMCPGRILACFSWVIYTGLSAINLVEVSREITSVWSQFAEVAPPGQVQWGKTLAWLRTASLLGFWHRQSGNIWWSEPAIVKACCIWFCNSSIRRYQGVIFHEVRRNFSRKKCQDFLHIFLFSGRFCFCMTGRLDWLLLWQACMCTLSSLL